MPRQSEKSNRKQAHDDLLRAAIARPGVSEVMRVYSNWRERDKGLDTYRSVYQTASGITKTGSKSISKNTDEGS